MRVRRDTCPGGSNDKRRPAVSSDNGSTFGNAAVYSMTAQTECFDISTPRRRRIVGKTAPDGRGSATGARRRITGKRRESVPGEAEERRRDAENGRRRLTSPQD